MGEGELDGLLPRLRSAGSAAAAGTTLPMPEGRDIRVGHVAVWGSGAEEEEEQVDDEGSRMRRSAGMRQAAAVGAEAEAGSSREGRLSALGEGTETEAGAFGIRLS